MKIKYRRVADFMDLFTEEEKAQWKGVDNHAPEWVREGIVWFMDQDPGHQELMRRLADS
jgi:hypothetical protein